MRLCADENFPALAVNLLQKQGHNIVSVAQLGRKIDDTKILALAQEEQLILLTFDKDFGELAFHRGLPASAGIILFRVEFTTPLDLAERLVRIVESRNDWSGFFSVVTDKVVRQRKLPS